MDIQLPVKDGIQATLEIRELERLANLEAYPISPTSPASSSTLSPTSTEMSSQYSSQGSPLLNMPVIIVALTASSLNADRVLGLQSGMNDFLTKPVSLKWLESKIREWGSLSLLGRGGRGAKEIRGGKEESFRRGVKGDTLAADVAAKLHLPPVPVLKPIVKEAPKTAVGVAGLDVAEVDAKLDSFLVEEGKVPIRPGPLPVVLKEGER